MYKSEPKHDIRDEIFLFPCEGVMNPKRRQFDAGSGLRLCPRRLLASGRHSGLYEEDLKSRIGCVGAGCAAQSEPKGIVDRSCR